MNQLRFSNDLILYAVRFSKDNFGFLRSSEKDFFSLKIDLKSSSHLGLDIFSI